MEGAASLPRGGADHLPPPPPPPFAAALPPEYFMYAFKVLACPSRTPHDWSRCAWAHPREQAKRRNPRLYSYSPEMCPTAKALGPPACARGDLCPLSHNVFEAYLHPLRFRTQMCKRGLNCDRAVCFSAHRPEELRQPSQERLVAAGNLAPPPLLLPDANGGALALTLLPQPPLLGAAGPAAVFSDGLAAPLPSPTALLPELPIGMAAAIGGQGDADANAASAFGQWQCAELLLPFLPAGGAGSGGGNIGATPVTPAAIKGAALTVLGELLVGAGGPAAAAAAAASAGEICEHGPTAAAASAPSLQHGQQQQQQQQEEQQQQQQQQHGQQQPQEQGEARRLARLCGREAYAAATAAARIADALRFGGSETAEGALRAAHTIAAALRRELSLLLGGLACDRPQA